MEQNFGGLKGSFIMENAERVLHYFEELSRIPRSSGDEKAICGYLISFAEEHGLEAKSDDSFNVIIKKPASIPNCKSAPVIIQGHTDMVYVRDENCKKSYEEGLELQYKDGWLSAVGTTLGADNGIAVAYALAVLESKAISHPDIEAVFTTSEEVGMLGAEHLDYSLLKGKYLLNLDTEDEGVFFTSCAGAFRNELKIPTERELVSGLQKLSVGIGGLEGGHSGMEIQNGRANAIILMARVLVRLSSDVHLLSLDAEGKTNAIATNASAELLVEESKIDSVISFIRELETEFKNEFRARDTVNIDISRGATLDAACYTGESFRKITNSLLLIPCGVLGMSFNITDLVETSANPGYIEQKDRELSVNSLARSSLGSRKEEMKTKYAAIATFCGGDSICTADYPQWEYRENSYLRELAMTSYTELFGKEATTCAIHAGLECGYFDERLEEVDIISYGPEIHDVHTPKERMNLESMERVWQLTQTILKKLAK